MPAHQRIKIAPDALPRKFFAALASHLHNIRIALVYTCIIPRVTISMFKIGSAKKVGHFHPESYLTFFRHGSFCFGQFLIWEVLQMTVIRPPWRNDYAIKSLIRSRAYWLRISGLWLCCWQCLIRLYASLTSMMSCRVTSEILSIIMLSFISR